jgi:lipopolysaccharide heptosyltransferase II
MENEKLKIKNILLCRTDKIGDVILTTPAVSVIKEHFPETKISFLAREYTKPLLENNPAIDKVITADGSLFSLIGKLKERKFDAAIVFFVNPKVALAVFLSGIPLRIGPASKPESIFFNQRIWQHRSKVEKHEADYNLQLVETLGASSKPRETRLFISPEEKNRVNNFFSDRGLKNNDLIIGIHPGGKGSAPRWPEEYFTQLAISLEKNLKAKIFLTGSSEESGIIQKIADKLSRPFVFAGELSLRELVALISKYRLLITNSTGPLHLAVALGIPTISFFSPILVTSPVRWGPYTLEKEKHRVFRPEIKECRECIFGKCKYFDCMKLVIPEEVYRTIERKISSS